MTALRQEIGTDEILQKLHELTAKVDALSKDNRPDWYTLQQVAEAWGRSLRTVQKQIADGKLPSTYRLGRRMVHRDYV